MANPWRAEETPYRSAVVGMGVTAYLGLTIGRDVVVSNGMHLMLDVPDGTLVRASS